MISAADPAMPITMSRAGYPVDLCVVASTAELLCKGLLVVEPLIGCDIVLPAVNGVLV